ncbi:fungal-specific transcription factor domain-containing protein [Exophiala viscosa]|uniref:Fungal-specific transcription factor domain-containing protein n=1 Tax=Exophiala viscosa TaxID=2486360 RepID=A0AAN6E3D8_9EURO|nr:fungal-specific transcription factor domain-containing protein [Exophiala viscosa]KAI1629842.1 fungal-specific transcription factor domain-containing protein [Exophiala viscosa]
MTLASVTPVVSSSPQSRRLQDAQAKRVVACNYCRAKKIRCNGGTDGPCTNCLDRKQECVSATPRRWRRRERSREPDDIVDRLARVEALLKQQPFPHTSTDLEPLPDFSTPLTGDCFRLLGGNDSDLMNPPQLPDQTIAVGMNEEGSQGHNLHFLTFPGPQAMANSSAIRDPGSLIVQRNSTYPADTTSSSMEWGSAYAPSTPFDPPNAAGLGGDSPEEIRERCCISSSEISNWEYHGPRSFLSICSKPGIQWVASKSGSSTFNHSAKKFTTYITSRLKIEKMLSRERKPEPDQETAWRFTRAFFEEALESALGIVHRPWFEMQLKSHFNGTISDADPAWYALRNVVYAFGCRIELSKCSSFKEATQSAWDWFENALSVHTEVLYFRTSIVGVQALTLMAYFTQNFGSPCLEYMLCSTAVRLSIAKGLHRQAVSSWNLTDHENSLRSCLFWAAYCLEKQIVCQSGRHSLIDDDDVSCQVPTSAPPNSTVNVEYFSILISLARLSSLVSKKLSTVRAFQQGAESVVRSVAELDEQLEALKSSMDPTISNPTRPKSSPSSSTMTAQQLAYLRSALFSLTLDMHTSLTYPWSRSMLGLTPCAALRDQVNRSTQIVAETCRKAILATEHVQFDASTPVPLGFFGPIHALINLFLYILQDPQRPGVQSDLALMDMGAGYFARVQFLTDSEVSISFVREMASLAHEVTEKASRRQASNTGIAYNQDLSNFPSIIPDSATDQDLVVEDQLSNDQTAGDMGTSWDLEWESWSTFLPTGDDIFLT